MILKFLSITIFVVLIGLSLIASQRDIQTEEFQTELTNKPERSSIYVGAWVGNFWDNDTRTLNTDVQHEFERAIGKKMAFANIYSQWSYLSDPKLIESLNEISSHGWTPIISTNPSFFSECPKGNNSLYETIASGDCDEFLKAVATNLKSYKGIIMFRFAWEMNLPSMYWSVDFVKSTPQDFVAAWKHFYTIFEQEQADNVKWVLSFNTSNSETIPYNELFPGDEYLDWVAIDGYNWGNTQEWGGWTSFNGVFKKSYEELVALSKKPVMLSEVNTSPTGTGGNKAEWLKDMLDIQLVTDYPQVQAIVFFNENKEKGESVDWRLETSPEVVAVIKKSLNTDLYLSDYP